jgi:hypothetical protein
MARIKWERTRSGDWRGYSPVYGYVRIQHSRKTKKWYLVNDTYTATLGVYDTKKAAQDDAQREPLRNARRRRVATAYRRAGVRVAKVNARGRRARKRNPIPRGRSLGEQSFTLSTLRAVKQGGRAERIWYEDARDGKHYYHDFDGAQGAVMYLCESAAVGKCILIVSGDLATPLWENA